jgi:hypothetical protein
LETFAWSGWVFNTLDLYLQNRHGFMVDNFGDADASAVLSKARGSFWRVLPASASHELLLALAAVECQTGDVTTFVADEHGPDGAADEAVAIQAALASLKAWLSEVAPGSIGLLFIG